MTTETEWLLFLLLLTVALRIVQQVLDHREAMDALGAILEALGDDDES